MIHARRIIVSLFLPFLIFPSISTGKTLQGRVAKVFDGDTLLIEVQGRGEFVRLREIDAPEVSRRNRKGQEPWGKRAREFAVNKIGNKTVRLEVEDRDDRDRYQRLLAYLFIGEAMLNQQMVRSGNAFFYPGPFRGKYFQQLEAAEEEARKKGSGVWKPNEGLRERPWDYRARTQREEGLFSPLSSRAARERRGK